MPSRSLAWPSLVIAVTLSFVAVPLTGQSALATRRVDASVAESDRSPLELFNRLKDAGIAVGLHVGAARWEQVRRADIRRPAGSGKTTVANAIETFRLAHPDWSVEVSDSAVVLRDIDISRRQDHIPELTVTGSNVTDAFAAAERAVNPSIPFTGGVAASIPSTPDAPAPRLPSVLVPLQLRDVGLEDILSSICSQVPGTGWVLIRHVEDGQVFDRLSVRHPNRLRTESHWHLPVPSGGPGIKE